MLGDPLSTIEGDQADDDSAIMAEVAESLRRGASLDEATIRARAGLAFATLREVRPIIRELVAAGDPPGLVSSKVLGVLARMPGFEGNRGLLGAVVRRALDAELAFDRA